MSWDWFGVTISASAFVSFRDGILAEDLESELRMRLERDRGWLTVVLVEELMLYWAS